ncbi:hypothetical protein GCM10017776_12740 [Streptomyces griseoluteus]|nr:hypothetical protein GCM10017776_12740 [Streptomyces griseoluteus]
MPRTRRATRGARPATVLAGHTRMYGVRTAGQAIIRPRTERVRPRQKEARMSSKRRRKKKARRKNGANHGKRPQS